MKYYFKEIKFSKLFDKEDLTDLEFNKLIEAIHVHGYRGASKMKHNGVVPIRAVYNKLWKDLEIDMEKESSEIKSQYKNCCAVKVVAHVPSGKRLIGYMYNLDDGNYGLYILQTSHY